MQAMQLRVALEANSSCCQRHLERVGQRQIKAAVEKRQRVW